jgi:hypothetical protein
MLFCNCLIFSYSQNDYFVKKRPKCILAKVLSIIHDIIDRKRVKEKLLESNEHLELTVKGANLGTWD